MPGEGTGRESEGVQVDTQVELIQIAWSSRERGREGERERGRERERKTSHVLNDVITWNLCLCSCEAVHGISSPMSDCAILAVVGK